ILATMFFSGGLIPTFLLVRSLGLLNTRMAFILPGLISAYNILIMRNFIMAIPDSIEESAYLDGANFFTILIKLIIPLSMPIFATISLWVAVYHWNEWFQAMIYTKGQRYMVLQMVLRMTINDSSSEDLFLDEIAGEDSIVPRSVQAATVIFTIGPIVLTYPFFQKYFVKGVMVGSLKG
ncbi:MAG: carbohydrate ABC transporter permease, partial [Spirochaetales bacterium]|nr:carbohydrate ABC transporter permease [Spirochaetales bacterium]